jgi:hypothetical protein
MKSVQATLVLAVRCCFLHESVVICDILCASLVAAKKHTCTHNISIANNTNALFDKRFVLILRARDAMMHTSVAYT